MYGVLISVAANGLILKYVLENEKNNCECALTWHHKFIKFYAPVVIFMAFIRLLFLKELQMGIKSNHLIKMLFSLIGLTSVAYVITLMVYFFKLKIEDCKCSEDWKRKVLIYPLIIIGVVVALVLFLMFVLGAASKKM